MIVVNTLLRHGTAFLWSHQLLSSHQGRKSNVLFSTKKSLPANVCSASHVASMEGWAIFDSYTEVSFGFETWHIELIIGLVILISSCRYMLLRIWPDFSESSKAANQQILGPLQPLDYVIVAFLPGISEGDICWPCLWCSNNYFLKCCGCNDLAFIKQSYRRPPMAPHIHSTGEK